MDVLQALAQHGGVLNGHGGALRHIGKHGVGGVAHDGDFARGANPFQEFGKGTERPFASGSDEPEDFGDAVVSSQQIWSPLSVVPLNVHWIPPIELLMHLLKRCGLVPGFRLGGLRVG